MQTPKAVHILVTNNRGDGGTVTTVERRIPLITIKSISMSNFQDDWLVSWHYVQRELLLMHL